MTAEDLFSFDNEQEDLVWMAEAIEEGFVKSGDYLPCTEVILTSSQKGFMLVCETPQGDEVYDWVWRKSKPGKQMFACFEDPTTLDNVRIEVKAQTKVKAAVLRTVSEAKASWVIAENDGRTSIQFQGKPVLKALPKSKPDEKSA